MSRKFLHMVTLLTGLLIFSSKTCEPDIVPVEQTDMKTNQDSVLRKIKNDFEADYLYNEQLRNFGERAKQKLLDFTDLLTLYSDKRMDTVFKQQINDMIIRLFYHCDAEIPFSIIQMNPAGKTKNTLSHLLQQIDVADCSPIRFTVHNLKTIEPFDSDSIDRYTGTLGCQFRMAYLTENDTLLLKETSNRIKIILTRAEKQFGDGVYRKIWQVYLDDIK